MNTPRRQVPLQMLTTGPQRVNWTCQTHINAAHDGGDTNVSLSLHAGDSWAKKKKRKKKKMETGLHSGEVSR